MKTTGLAFSALLVAAGAILAWAVTYEAEGVDLNQVGIILFIVGLALGGLMLVASLLASRTTVETEREAIVDGQRAVEHRRDVVNHG